MLTRDEIPPAPAILDELLAELRDLGRSDRHICGLRRDAGKFAGKYPRLETANDPGIVVGYLRAVAANVGPRRRDNVRDAIVELFRFARRRGYLPEEKRSAAEKIKKIKPGHDVSTWTPAEARLLLETVDDVWIPVEAIGLFAGLRRSEIWRLDWSAFKWEARDRHGEPAPMIAVTRKIARKIRVDRLVPITECLASWLAPYRDRVGPLYPGNFKTVENRHSEEMVRVRRITGLPRKDNANRHSFGSHRLAIIKSYEQVAFEMGNSPRKVREDYNDPKPEDVAIEYFSLFRRSLDNVVPLNLPLVFQA
jgi:integrase